MKKRSKQGRKAQQARRMSNASGLPSVVQPSVRADEPTNAVIDDTKNGHLRLGKFGKYSVGIGAFIAVVLALNEWLDLYNNANAIPRWVAIGIPIVSLLSCYLLYRFFMLNRLSAVIAILAITAGIWVPRFFSEWNVARNGVCEKSFFETISALFPSKLPNKFIIAVARFKGPGTGDNIDIESFSDDYITRVESLKKEFSELEVIPINEVITQGNGGSAKAKELGKCADIVVWGFYNSDSVATVFVELIKEPKYLREFSQKLTKDGREVFKYSPSIIEKRELSVTDVFSGDVNRLSLLLAGLVRYQSGNYEDAIRRFSMAVNQEATIQSVSYLSDLLLLRGSSFAAKSDFDSAIEDYIRGLTYKPDSPEAYANLGSAYVAKGRYEDAMAYTDCAISYRQDFADAYSNRAVLFAIKRDYDKALADCDYASRLQPDLQPVYANRALIYAAKGQYDKAIANYDQAIRIRSDIAELYHGRGKTYEEKGDYDSALKDHDYAIALSTGTATSDKSGDIQIVNINLSSRIPDFYLERGNVYKRKGYYDRAVSDYNTAIKLRRDFAMAYSNRGVAYKQLNDLEKAKEDWDFAISLDQNCEEAYFNRGTYWEVKGDYAKAIEEYNHAATINPPDAENHFRLGKVYFGMKNFYLAIRSFSLAIERRETYVEAYLMRGNAYQFSMDYEKAMEDYTRAVGIQSNLAEAYFGRGRIYQMREVYDKAIIEYNQAIDLKSNFAAAYFGRGCVLWYTGDTRKAMADWDHTIDLDNKYAEAYLMRGGQYFLSGDISRASSDFQKAYDTAEDAATRDKANTVLQTIKTHR